MGFLGSFSIELEAERSKATDFIISYHIISYHIITTLTLISTSVVSRLLCTVRCTHSSMNHPHHVHSFAGEGGHVCVVGITVAMQSLLISICLGLASEFPISLAQRCGYKTHPRAKHKRLVFIRFSGKKNLRRKGIS